MVCHIWEENKIQCIRESKLLHYSSQYLYGSQYFLAKDSIHGGLQYGYNINKLLTASNIGTPNFILRIPFYIYLITGSSFTSKNTPRHVECATASCWCHSYPHPPTRPNVRSHNSYMLGTTFYAASGRTMTWRPSVPVRWEVPVRRWALAPWHRWCDWGTHVESTH